MSRFCKECVWKISIFLVDWRCHAVKRGIIGRLGKIFVVALNFYGAEICRFERNVQKILFLTKNQGE